LRLNRFQKAHLYTDSLLIVSSIIFGFTETKFLRCILFMKNNFYQRNTTDIYSYNYLYIPGIPNKILVVNKLYDNYAIKVEFSSQYTLICKAVSLLTWQEITFYSNIFTRKFLFVICYFYNEFS
jgi:hypothetical protein